MKSFGELAELIGSAVRPSKDAELPRESQVEPAPPRGSRGSATLNKGVATASSKDGVTEIDRIVVEADHATERILDELVLRLGRAIEAEPAWATRFASVPEALERLQEKVDALTFDVQALRREVARLQSTNAGASLGTSEAERER
jgi:hypothetical protein